MAYMVLSAILTIYHRNYFQRRKGMKMVDEIHILKNNEEKLIHK